MAIGRRCSLPSVESQLKVVSVQVSPNICGGRAEVGAYGEPGAVTGEQVRRLLVELPGADKCRGGRADRGKGKCGKAERASRDDDREQDDEVVFHH